MAFEITARTLAESLGTDLRPQLVLEIEGVTDIFTTTAIKKIIEYGDPDLDYGDGDTYGGLKAIDDQETVISFQQGTSTTINQTLNLEKGLGESISSMRIALVDKDEEISALLKPDDTQTPTFDLLGRRVRVWYGFDSTAFKDDFITIFRGVIQGTQSKPGLILLNINHPDDKKRSSLFQVGSTELSSLLTAGATVADVDDTSAFLAPVTGPGGTVDESIKFYIRIDDEIIRYEATSGTQFQTLTRGELGTTAASHAIDAEVESFYRLEGNAIDLALKLMFSGSNGPFLEDQTVTSFLDVGLAETAENAIFFEGIDVGRDFGIVVGDFVTVTGATNGANNVTLEAITGIISTENGDYITIDPATDLVLESPTSAVIDFRSQYDTLGEGAQMKGDEVDVDEHLLVQRNFLSSWDYDFYIKEEINLKEFLSEQVYNPAAAYSLPRKSKASVGYHLSGQLPGSSNKVLNTNTVLNASKLTLQRSTSKNFFNAVTYKFEEEELTDKLLKIDSDINVDSTARIPVGIKNKIIEARGMRVILSAINNANIARDRILKKFKFGAEFIKGVKVNLKTGFDLEVGDTMILDLDDLNITDINTGTRAGDPRIFQIINKGFDLRSGNISLDIVDTNFDRDVRYALMGPCSCISLGISTTQFIIKETGNSIFGINEFKKWENFIGTGVLVRSEDFTTSDQTVITAINGNTITVSPALSGAPSSGFFMELDEYDNAIDTVKLLYGHMTDNATFADGESQYLML